MYLFAVVSSCSPAANVPPSSLSVETLYVAIWNSRQTESIQSVSAAVLCCLSVFSGSIERIWVSHGHTGQCGLGFTWYSSNIVMKYWKQHSKVKSDANQFNFADALQKPGVTSQIQQQSRKNSLLKRLIWGGGVGTLLLISGLRNSTIHRDKFPQTLNVYKCLCKHKSRLYGQDTLQHTENQPSHAPYLHINHFLLC